MKNKISIIVSICLLCLFYYGCKKDIFSVGNSSRPLSDSDRVELSKKTIENKYAGYLKEKSGKILLNWLPDWKGVTFLKKNDSVNLVYIPLQLEIIDSISKRRFEDVRSSKSKRFIIATFSANNVVNYQIGTYISTQNTSLFNGDFKGFSGNAIYKDLDGKNVLRQMYVNGKPSIEKKKQINSKLSVNTTDCKYFYSCFYVSYNEYPGCAPRYELVGGYDSCSEPDPSSGGCYYVFRLVSTDIQSECSTTTNPNYPPPPPTGGGTGTPGTGTGSNDLPFTDNEMEHAKIVLDDRRKPINPVNYINCFTDGKQASNYKMTVYVDQPIHGQNDQFAILPDATTIPVAGIPVVIGDKLYDVGHTFMMFEKVNTDGSSVKQIFGFYPGGNGVYSKGVIKDDSGHPYDVSYTFLVDQGRFEDALNNVITDSETGMYQLFRGWTVTHDEYNCTDAALTWAFTAGHYEIPSPSRGVFSNTPGDCGAALYNSNLNVNKTAGNAPIGKGPCN
jgi:hypothetical protein